MAKRLKLPEKVFSTIHVPRDRRVRDSRTKKWVTEESRPTGNAFRLRERPSWFDTDSPVYTKQNPMCSVVGKGKGQRCPVQFFFRNGEAALRFCDTPGAPGRVVSVGDDFVKANKKATELCKCWHESSPDPSKRSFKGCKGMKSAPLGGLRRR